MSIGKANRLGLNNYLPSILIHGDYTFVREMGDLNNCHNQTVDKILWEYCPICLI